MTLVLPTIGKNPLRQYHQSPLNSPIDVKWQFPKPLFHTDVYGIGMDRFISLLFHTKVYLSISFFFTILLGITFDA